MRDSNNPSAKGWAMAARCLTAAALVVVALGLLAAPAAADPVEQTPVINTTVDQNLGDCSITCSLRDAVFLSSPGDTLAVPAGHYVLTLGDIAINQSLTLAGAGARTTVIDGNNTSGGDTGGIFNMTGAISVELDDVSLVNGVANQQGGAISAFGLSASPLALTIRRCTIANNQVTGGQAGGIALIFGTLDLEDSTVSNNSTFPLGGSALFTDVVTGSIVNSTLTGNSGPSFANGSVVLISSTMSLTNNTITANPGGKGLRVFFSPLTLSNNIIAGNPGGDCQFTSSPAVTDHNIDSDNSCGLTGPGDLPGVNPLLGPLANNGGMTDTQALLAGSPAIDAGNNATCPPTDQRGISRPQGPACDIGAYEVTHLDCSHATASPNLLWPPNNKFVAIQISGIPDPGGPAAAITVTSIFQDEPVTKGPDATGVGTSTPSVRAQRDGGGDGRVYHLFFTASANGGSCMGAVTVGVPHDQGPNGGPVDEGPLFDSTQP